MRLIATLSLVLVLCGVHAQRPGIATLLSLADCLDTTCVSEHLRPIDYCPYGGKEEDGWMWGACVPFDQWSDQVAIGFMGYAMSNWREYSVSTRDTSTADVFTAELSQLGFTIEKSISDHADIYRNAAYPALEVHHLEKRASTIHYKRSGDANDPRALPKDSIDREEYADLLKMTHEDGYENFELIPELLWKFEIRIPTPHLGILPGETDGTVELFYPVSDPVAEFIIRDLSGQEVLRSMTQDWRTVIDVSELSDGIHYLTIFTKRGMISKAFIKN